MRRTTPPSWGAPWPREEDIDPRARPELRPGNCPGNRPGNSPGNFYTRGVAKIESLSDAPGEFPGGGPG